MLSASRIRCACSVEISSAWELPVTALSGPTFDFVKIGFSSLVESPKKIEWAEAIRSVVPLWGVLGATFLLVRVAEYALVQANHVLPVSIGFYEVLGAAHDLKAVLLFGAALTVAYVLLFSFSRRGAFWAFAGSTFVLGLTQLGLAYYYAKTLQPLGRDLLGYSLTEVASTVKASGTAGLGPLMATLALAGVVFGLSLFARRLTAPAWAGYVGGALLAVSLLVELPNPGAGRAYAEYLSVNKTTYLLSETTGALFGTEAGVSGRRASGKVAGITALQDTVSRQYPWMYKAKYEDVLGPFFDIPDSGESPAPPNLVFIVFEGLGTDFVGKENTYGGFTPFVDSLREHSLYWPNVVSTTGRTFGLMPSLFGSLPYASRGFMEMGDNMPAHRSLISVLGDRGYYTSYYSGFDLSFDNVDRFLRRQSIDRATGRNALQRMFADDPGVAERYWGYPDKEMFNRVESILDTTDRSPQLSIFHTLQTHDPFSVPNESKYAERFERRLSRMDLSDERRARYETYEDKLTTFLYTDQAIQQFFRWYRTQPEFENTVFVITGDHRLIPIPQPSQIARYHVPLLIYSPLLEESQQFRSVSTLADIAPTIMGFLREQYGLAPIERSHWLGTPVDTTRQFRSARSMPLMRNKNQMVDYLHKRHYLADGQLYRLQEGLRLAPVSDQPKREKLQARLARFKTINQYVTSEDRLYSPSVPLETLPPTTPLRAASTSPAREISPGVAARAKIDSVLAEIDRQDLTPSAQFQMARSRAFDGDYGVARAIAERLLDQTPGYHDVRLLVGRTYAWEGNYDQAREAFQEVLRRDPSYYDTYNALADTELWAGRPEVALEVLEKGLARHPGRPSYLVKKAEALLALNRTESARATVDALRQADPDNDALSTLNSRLKP